MRYAWVPVPALLALMAALWTQDPSPAYEPRYLLLACNIVFTGLASAFVAVLAGRGFLLRGAPALLLLGCGAVSWGGAGLLAGVLAPESTNAAITVYNSLVWVSAACFLGTALLTSRPAVKVTQKGLMLAAAAAGMFSIIIFVFAVARDGLLPVFFVQGRGGTPLRTAVLVSAIAMFALTAVVLIGRYRRDPSAFQYLFGLSMVLIAGGLLGVMLTAALGSALNWAGRSSQFLAGVYMLAAAIAAVRASRSYRISLEDMLAETSSRYQALADMMPDAVVVHRDGGFLYANPAALRLYGAKTLNQLKEHTIYELLHPDCRANVKERVEGIMKGGHTPLREQILLRLGGGEVPVEVTGAPVAYEGTPAVIAVIRDITERKRLKDSIDRERHMVDKLMEFVPDGITICDSAMNLIRVSRHGQELLGDHQGLSVNGVVARMPVYCPDGITPMLDEELPLVKAFRTGEHVRNVELVQMNLRGEALPLLCNAAPVRDGAGEIIGGVVAWRDITERKRLEAQIRENEERFRSIFENSTVGKTLTAPDGKLMKVNRAFADMLGYTVDEMQKLDFTSITHPDDVAESRECIRCLLEGEKPSFRMEKRYIHKNGEPVIADVSTALQRNADGKPLFFITSISDITERKRMEEELRKSRDELEERVQERTQELRTSESQFRAVVETANEAIITLNIRGEILLFNTAAEEMLGYGRDEVIGRSATMLMTEETKNMFIAYADELSATGVEPPGYDRPLEIEYVKKDGTIVPLEMSASACDSGGELYLIGLMRDISERKRAEAAVRESEERYRTLIETTNTGYLLVDEMGNVKDANAEYVRLTGHRDLGEILGRNVLEWTAEYDFERNRREVVKCMENGAVSNLEVDYIGTSGCVTPIEINARVMQTGNGSIILSMCRDITERRKAEEEKKKLNEQLIQAQKMEAVGMLAGGVAHDFNNLLTPIIGYSEIGLMNLRPEDPLHNDLNEIKKAGERAQGLTRQLLAFGRKQALEMKVLKLDEEVKVFSKMLGRLIKESIEIEYVHDKALGSVRADPSQIQQIIINLAVNANDAMPDGGRLVIETANVDLDEDYCARHPGAQPGPHVMLAVSDTGGGMDAATRDRVFEPFFTTKGVGKGTGLGLSTVFGIVKQHGGSIYVYSEPGQGTTFKVYLPRVDEAPVEDTRNAVTKPALGNETILVIEDDRMVRDLARRVLETSGYKVIVAETPGDALIFVQKNTDPIDLILTDVVMPQMNGKEVHQKISEARPGIKVLFMSGYTQNVIAHHGVLDEGIEFIQKPFTLDVLTRKVRETLDL